MEELVGTLRGAQCAVLHTKRDLVLLRELQEELRRDGVVGDETLLRLQMVSQTKQEDAVRHLERAVQLLCGITTDRAEGCTTQKEVNAEKRAIRRYFESQLDAHQRRENECRLQLQTREAQVASIQHLAVMVAQRAYLRQLGMRALCCWRRRTIITVFRRERAEMGGKFCRGRLDVVCSYAKTRRAAALRTRCFYRWRMKCLCGVLEARCAKQEILEADLQRVESDLVQHMELQRTCELRLQQEREDEVMRLKTTIDEMACEFRDRTSTYVRQQEELTHHYSELERRLLHDAIITEQTSRCHKERAAQLKTVLAVHETSHPALIDAMCSVMINCMWSKVNLLYHATQSAMCKATERNAELEAQVTLLRQQLAIMTPLGERVMLLETRFESARHCVEANKEAMRRAMKWAAAALLQRVCLMKLTCRWRSWLQYATERRYSRSMHKTLADVETQRQWQMREWLQREEAFDRRHILTLEVSDWQLLGSRVDCMETRTHATQTHAELIAERQRCAHEAARAEKCRRAMETMQRELLHGVFIAERKHRFSLQYDELLARQNLREKLDLCRVKAQREAEEVMQTDFAGVRIQLQEVSTLVVEYCARDAFSRWVLFTDRRRRRRDKMHAAMLTAAMGVWIDASTACAAHANCGKLQMFLEFMHHIMESYIASAHHQLVSSVATATNETIAVRAEFDTHMRASLQRYGEMWCAFASTASRWCADREQLLLDVPLTKTATSAAAAASSLQQAMSLVSAEKEVLAEHVRNVVDVMRSSTLDALLAQEEQHEARVGELLQYQYFLEQRIAIAGLIEDDSLSMEERQRETREVQERVESLLAELECSNARHDKERKRHEEAVAVLRLRLKQQEEDHEKQVTATRDQHEREIRDLQAECERLTAEFDRVGAVRDAAVDYERVLSSFVEGAAGLCGAFTATASTLVSVEYFSDFLLRRYEANLERIRELWVCACEDLRLQHTADGEARAMLAQRDAEVAALVQTLQVAREQSDAACRELRMQSEKELCEARQACAVRIRQETREVQERVESLLAELECSNARHDKERKRHEEAVAVLRLRLKQQEEDHEKQVTATHDQHEREIRDLQAECERLTAEFDRVGAVRDAAVDYERVEGELQSTEPCDVLNSDGNRVVLQDGPAFHSSSGVKVLQQLVCCEMLLEAVRHFTERRMHTVCDTVDAKIGVLLACCGELRLYVKTKGKAASPPALWPLSRRDRHFIPSRRALSTSDVTHSMLRYSRLVDEQRCKNDMRLQRIDNLVTTVDDLIEHGRAVKSLHRSVSEHSRSRPTSPR